MEKHKVITQEMFLRADKKFESYKRETDMILRSDEYIVAHIDGIKFTSKYLKKLTNEDKEKVFNILVDTAMTLCNEFKSIRLAYVCSDEISLLIDGEEIKDNYHNRIQKLCSIISSIASLTFYKKLKSTYSDVKELEDLMSHSFFAVKCFNIPDNMVNDYFHVRLKGCKKCIFDRHEDFDCQPEWKKYGALITRIEEKWQKDILDFQSLKLIKAPQNDFYSLVNDT